MKAFKNHVLHSNKYRIFTLLFLLFLLLLGCIDAIQKTTGLSIWLPPDLGPITLENYPRVDGSTATFLWAKR